MKIVNLETFRELPKGTIYSEYEPCIFTGLFRKGETWDIDYLETNLIAPIKYEFSSGDIVDVLDRAAESGGSVELDFESRIRNGSFNYDQLFAIYERDDILDLISILRISVFEE